MRISPFRILQLIVLVFFLNKPSQAVIINGNTADAIVRQDTLGNTSTINLGNTQIRTGEFTTGSGFNFATVYPFLLPNLGAVSNPFLTADFTFNLNAIDTTDPLAYNADLYGLDARAAATVLGSDFYSGPAIDPSASATFLEDSILTPGSATGTTTSVDIASYLNAQYNGGAGAGQYVFLRVSNDSAAINDDRNGYLIATANAAANGPIINFTSIPEPSSVLVLSFFVMILFGGRRVRRSFT